MAERGPGCGIEIGGAICGQPGELFDAGCPHEHISAGLEICPDHEHLLGTDWYCTPCEETALPHKCRVTIRRSGDLYALT